MLAFIGQQVGERWEDWKDSLHYVDYAVAAVIVIGVDLPRRAAPARARRAVARGRRRCPAGLTPARSRSATPSPSGALHGPAELLPVSSSAHTTLVPWLLRLAVPGARPRAAQGLRGRAARGHARPRCSSACATRSPRPRAASTAAGATLVAGSFVPPAIVGLTLERPIERRLGTPPTIAAGLARGRRWRWRSPTRAGRARRARDDGDGGRRARARPGPGVRARARRVAQRRDADRRARARLPPRRRQRAVAPRRAAGDRRGDACSRACGSRAAGCRPASRRRSRPGRRGVRLDALSVRLIRAVERDRSLLPYAAYRLALAALVLRRVR